MGIDWTEKSPEHPINWERDWRELRAYADLVHVYAKRNGLPSPTVPLSCGFMGCAFFTDAPDVIVKLTYDASEADLLRQLAISPEEGFVRVYHYAPAKVDDAPDIAWKEYAQPATPWEGWVNEYLRYSPNRIKTDLDYGSNTKEAVGEYDVYLSKVIAGKHDMPFAPIARGLRSLLKKGFIVEDVRADNMGLSQDGKHYVVYDAQLVALEDFLEDES